MSEIDELSQAIRFAEDFQRRESELTPLQKAIQYAESQQSILRDIPRTALPERYREMGDQDILSDIDATYTTYPAVEEQWRAGGDINTLFKERRKFGDALRAAEVFTAYHRLDMDAGTVGDLTVRKQRGQQIRDWQQQQIEQKRQAVQKPEWSADAPWESGAPPVTAQQVISAMPPNTFSKREAETQEFRISADAQALPPAGNGRLLRFRNPPAEGELFGRILAFDQATNKLYLQAPGSEDAYGISQYIPLQTPPGGVFDERKPQQPKAKPDYKAMGKKGIREKLAETDPLERIPFLRSVFKTHRLQQLKAALSDVDYVRQNGHWRGDYDYRKIQDIQQTVSDFADAMEEAEERGVTIPAQVTDLVANMAPWAFEIAATGGMFGATKAPSAVGALRYALGMAKRSAVRTLINPAAVAAAALEREVYRGSSPGRALMAGLGDVFISYFAEESGALLGYGASKLVTASQVPKVLQSIGRSNPRLAQFGTAIDRAWKKMGKDGSAVGQALRAGNFHGVFDEMGEERVEALLRSVTGLDAESISEALRPGNEQLLVELIGLSVPGVPRALGNLAAGRGGEGVPAAEPRQRFEMPRIETPIAYDEGAAAYGGQLMQGGQGAMPAPTTAAPTTGGMPALRVPTAPRTEAGRAAAAVPPAIVPTPPTQPAAQGMPVEAPVTPVESTVDAGVSQPLTTPATPAEAATPPQQPGVPQAEEEVAPAPVEQGAKGLTAKAPDNAGMSIEDELAHIEERLFELDQTIPARERYAVPKAERPDLNAKERQRLANAQYQQSLTPEQQAAIDERSVLQIRLSTLRAEKDFKQRQTQRAQWPGTDSVASQVAKQLEEAGIEFRRFGYEGDSQYFDVDGDVIRVSDHDQPTGGGFSEIKQERHGEAAINITPYAGTAVDIVAQVRALQDSPPAKPPAPAQPEAPPAAEPDVPPAGPQKGVVYQVPADSLSVDPNRFQYKSGMDRKTGASRTRMKDIKQWVPESGGVIAVWRDPADGRDYVVNGHHRYALAKRFGVKNLNVLYLDVKTAKEARVLGALINIREDQGTAVDAARIFREGGYTAEKLKTEGTTLTGKVAREGLALAQLTDPLFNMVALEKMPVEWGVAIGENLPDKDLQVELWESAQAYKGKMTVEMVREMAHDIATEKERGDTVTTGAATLFGGASESTLRADRSLLVTEIASRLRADKRLFGPLLDASKAARLEAAGTSVDAESAKRIVDETSDLIKYFEYEKDRLGEIRKILNQGALRLADGAAKQETINDVYEQVTAEIKQLLTAPLVGPEGAKGIKGVAGRKGGVGAKEEAPLLSAESAAAEADAARQVEDWQLTWDEFRHMKGALGKFKSVMQQAVKAGKPVSAANIRLALSNREMKELGAKGKTSAELAQSLAAKLQSAPRTAGGATPAYRGPDIFRPTATATVPAQGRTAAGTKAIETTRPLRPRQIVKNAAKRFRFALRTGYLRRRKAVGTYDVREAVTRLKNATSIPTLAHELGHHLQAIMFRDVRTPKGNLSAKAFPPELRKELQGLAYEGAEGKTVEGFGEFLRYYMTEPQMAEKSAPNFYKWWENHVQAAQPEIWDALKQTQQEIAGYYDQPARAKVLAQLSVNEKTPRHMSIPTLITGVSDQYYPLLQAMQEVYPEGTVTSKNFYKLARLYEGAAPGRALAAIHDGIRDYNDPRRRISEGLTTILQPVATRLDDLRAYLVSLRAIELGGRNIMTGIDLSDAQQVVNDVEANDPQLVEAAQRIYGFNDALLDYMKDAGILSADAVAAMRKANTMYVPFYRVFEEAARMGGGKRGFVNLPQAIKRIKGSGREIIDPIEGMVRNLYMYTALAEKNRVSQVLVAAAQSKEGLGWLASKVSPKRYPIHVSAPEIRQMLRKLGVDDTEIASLPDDAFVNIFRASMTPSHKEAIASVFNEGKPEFWQFDPEIYEALTQMGTETTNLLVKLLSKPAGWLRVGATGTPEFIMRNVLRDNTTAAIQSEFGFVPGVDFVRGLFDVVGKTKDYWDWQAAGGAHGALVSIDRDYLQESIKQMTRNRDFQHLVQYGLTHPWRILTALRAASEHGEEATRMGEYLRGPKRDVDEVLDAAYSSREVTTDFKRTGSKPKAWNRITAFFNATLQGNLRYARAMKDHPLRTTLRSLLYITIPSLVLYAINRKDKYYEELPAYRRMMFWNIPIGGGRFIPIPKPHIAGYVFGSLPESILSWMETKDPERMEEWATSVKNDLAPSVIPTAFLPMLQWKTNYDLFRERPIVSRSQEYDPPEMQFGPYTSETAKIAGEVLEVSPAKIDATISSVFAGLGRYGTEFTDKAIMLIDSERNIRPKQRWWEALPGLRTFVSDTMRSSADSLTDFYVEVASAEVGAKRGDVAATRRRDNLRMYSAVLRRQRQYWHKVYANPSLDRTAKAERLRQVMMAMINTARAGLGRQPLDNPDRE